MTAMATMARSERPKRVGVAPIVACFIVLPLIVLLLIVLTRWRSRDATPAEDEAEASASEPPSKVVEVAKRLTS